MAKACGLRIGPRRFELFVLDGSPKKPKIVASLAGEIPPDELDPVGAASHALKSAIKAHRISTDNVGVVLDAHSAAFRHLSLPVSDTSKIESVIKFEVEAQLPQFNIDEIIVDSYIQNSATDASNLIVTAVPKEDVSAALETCVEAGFEALEAEVETTALVNAAWAAGLCALDSAQVLVHVGEESTAVAVVDGGIVREMRVIQAGALSYTPHGTPPPPLEEGAEEAEAPVERDYDEASSGPQPIERAGEIVQRLRRELARTVSAARTVQELGIVHVSGFQLHGMVGEDILGVPVEAMEGFTIDSFEGDVHTEYSSAAVAYGAAIRQMGGGLINASLRREDLRFSGTLERIELPLAVLCLLMTTFLGVWFMFLEKERATIDRDLIFMLDSSVNYMMGRPEKGMEGNLKYQVEKLESYVQTKTGPIPGTDPVEYRMDPARNRYEQLQYIRAQLNTERMRLQKELGHDSELTQPQSALKGLTLVLDLLARDENDKFGRVSFRTLKADYRTSTRGEDTVIVTLALSFFAENSYEATSNYEAFSGALKTQDWFVKIDSKRSDPFDGVEKGVHLPSLVITVDVSKAEEAVL